MAWKTRAFSPAPAAGSSFVHWCFSTPSLLKCKLRFPLQNRFHVLGLFFFLIHRFPQVKRPLKRVLCPQWPVHERERARGQSLTLGVPPPPPRAVGPLPTFPWSVGSGWMSTVIAFSQQLPRVGRAVHSAISGSAACQAARAQSPASLLPGHLVHALRLPHQESVGHGGTQPYRVFQGLDVNKVPEMQHTPGRC